MKIERGNVNLEMTNKEYNDIVFCLRMYAENAHIGLIMAENREDKMQIQFATKKFNMAVYSYENMSGKIYDILEQEMILKDKMPRLRNSF